MAASLRADEIYDRLRSDIVHGELRPNQRLVEVELAERLETSRTPVRETLQRLVLDGLVLRRREGWVVHEHSAAEIRSIYEVRAALEGYAALLAAERITGEDLAALEALYPAGEAAFHLPPDRQVELNESFHDAVIAAAANPRLAELCTSSRQYYFNYRIARLFDESDNRRSIEGHRRILAALADRDAAAAEASARRHVGDALEIVLTKLS